MNTHWRRTAICFGLSVLACNSARQLRQEDVEKTVRGFASTSPFEFRGGGGCSFTPQGIGGIQPLAQFSETEASAVVVLNCAGGGRTMPLKAVFRRDVNGKWFLTALGDPNQASYQVDAELLLRLNENLRVPVQ